MEKKWYYDAFISYRHTELDSFVAKNLHKQLESFKLPKNVAKKLQVNAKENLKADEKEGIIESKTRITRVFRDQEELPLVSNLADPIMEALEKSEFLIVICSPRLKESMWCRKEIETFISLHDREHVLAVLVEGEPEDSFPEELLYREVEEMTDDGSVIKKKVPVEPLAADVRGNSETEIKRKIKSEVLRLVAPMFQCGYDDLRQRHREQKMRKIITASLAGSGVCLAFGIVSTTMALQIQRQNVQITEQSEEIAKQADEIEAQYIEAMRSNCISQAQASANLLEEGDRIGAIETALAAYPSEENPDIPYTAQANFALTESLRLYEDGSLILPDRMLEAGTTIDFMKISPEGSKVLTVDDFGELCVWDGTSGEKVASFMIGEDVYYDENAFDFINENAFLYPTEEGISCYDTVGQTEVYTIECDSFFSSVICSKETNNAVISNEEGFKVFEKENGALVSEGDWQDAVVEAELEAGAVFAEDGTYFAVGLSSVEKNVAAVYETVTGNLHRIYEVANSNIEYLKFVDGVLYVLDNAEFDVETISTSDGMLYACDLTQDNTFLWTYLSEGRWVYEVSVATQEDSNYMLCTSYGTAVVLDKRDGSYIDTFSFNSEIVKLGNYIGTNTFLVFTRDGAWHYVNLDRMEDMVGTTFSHCNSSNVKAFELGDGYCATLPYLDKSVTLYRNAIGNNFEVLYDADRDFIDSAISADGAYLAVNSYGSSYATYIEMIDTKTGEVLWCYEGDDYCDGMRFYAEKDLFILITYDAIHLLDVQNGVEKTTYSVEAGGCDYLGTDATGRYVFLKSYNTIYVCDLEDGSIVYEHKHEEELMDGSAVSVSPDGELYAIADKGENSLQLYYMAAEASDCISQIKDVNATYAEYIFFGADSASLYVSYKDGRLVCYPIDRVSEPYLVEEGDTADEGSVVAYEELEDCMKHFIQPQGADYSIVAGEYDAYLTSQGELLAHINSFLAVDGTKNCIYLTDGSCIYRAPIYTQEELRQEAINVIAN